MPLIDDQIPALQHHFDVQLAGLRAMVEGLSQRVEAHNTTQVTQIATIAHTLAEVKGDVKAQNGRVTRGEDSMKSLQEHVAKSRDELAYIKGQRSGGNGVYNALMAAIGALVGAVGVAIAISRVGG